MKNQDKVNPELNHRVCLGYADRESNVAWKRNTRTVLFSATKVGCMPANDLAKRTSCHTVALVKRFLS